ncbi:siderophore-interacting protein [Fluviicola sp.]|uniref:siderophore-interacting protein n=1 Tax=Fluviicola sp. TaxID=1917219 RepID=UPI0031CFD58D
MAAILKKAMSGLLDKMLGTAKVIGVNRWEPETMVEIDVQMPGLNMDKWKTIHRVKCKVGELEYRDYTPSCWNAEKGTFKLYVEAGHDGVGSRWAQQIQAGDTILLGSVHASQIPVKEGKVLCLVDLSALGHALSLKQLTDHTKFPLEVGVFLHESYEIPQVLINENPEFEFLYRENEHNVPVLEKWLMSKKLANYESICIAGNTPMVSQLRKKLKAIPEVGARILAQGFWS